MALFKRKARLLLLDDDPSMQRLITLLLRREGYAVDVVSEASAAIARLGSNDYAALLLDIMTPTEGGMTVIKHLRESHPTLLKRVILVTGSPDFLLKSVERDVFAIVRKPLDAAELKATVSRLVTA